MIPREFLEQVVRPNVADFRKSYDSFRHAYNAVAAVDALAAHIYVWCTTNAPHHISGVADDSKYRAKLAAVDQDFALLRDIAKAQKHVSLTQGKPQVAEASQITTRSIGFGEGGFGEGRFDGGEQVVVDFGPGTFTYVEDVVSRALVFLESEMLALGI